jgi:hypothetical protein
MAISTVTVSQPGCFYGNFRKLREQFIFNLISFRSEGFFAVYSVWDACPARRLCNASLRHTLP